MRPSRILGVLFGLALASAITGCAGVTYREDATVVQTRYAVVQSYADQDITAEQVDGLLEDVAAILKVRLDPTKPKVRIMVTSPSRIHDLYRASTTVAGHSSDAAALYFPGAGLVVVSGYDRGVLGHELAHYVTDKYLTSTPRGQWERVALGVERQLERGATRAAAPAAPAVAMAGSAAGPLLSEPVAY